MVIWKSDYDEAEIKNVRIVEKRLSIQFPQDYLNYAIKYQGGKPSPSNILVEDEGVRIQLSCLLTFLAFDELDILERYNSVKNLISTGLIPFGLGSDEYLFCFDYRSGNVPSIVLCRPYSDSELKEVYVCNSFNDLIDKLF